MLRIGIAAQDGSANLDALGRAVAALSNLSRCAVQFYQPARNLARSNSEPCPPIWGDTRQILSWPEGHSGSRRGGGAGPNCPNSGAVDPDDERR